MLELSQVITTNSFFTPKNLMEGILNWPSGLLNSFRMCSLRSEGWMIWFLPLLSCGLCFVFLISLCPTVLWEWSSEVDGLVYVGMREVNWITTNFPIHSYSKGENKNVQSKTCSYPSDSFINRLLIVNKLPVLHICFVKFLLFAEVFWSCIYALWS